MQELVTYEELFKAYLDCLRHKSRTENACNFIIELPKNLYDLHKELNNGTYQVGLSSTFIVDRPGTREVFAGNFRDRIVHHLIINRIMLAFESTVIDNSFSCRVNKGTLFGAMTLKQNMEEISKNYTKDAYVLKCDLKAFFMTINKQLLYDCVSDLIKTRVHRHDQIQCDFLCNLTHRVIMHCPQYNCIIKGDCNKWKGLPKDKSLFYAKEGCGLPIGNLTSQIFANLFLDKFDKYVLEELGFKYYGRYVDDFYILSEEKEKLTDAIPKITNFLADMGITLHPKKRYLQHVSKGVTFLGVTIKPGCTFPIKRTISNLHKMLWEEYDYFQNAGEHNIREEDVDRLITRFNSYMGLMCHHNTYKFRKRLCRKQHMCYFMPKYVRIDGQRRKMIKTDYSHI